MCLGLWYQEGNIFGVSFWERKKKQRVDEVFNFFMLINFTSFNFDTRSKKYTNVTAAYMLSAVHPFCQAIKRQLCYRRMSHEPQHLHTVVP